jgi:hypothetical protein
MFYIDIFKPVKTERTHDGNFKIAFWVSCIILIVIVAFTAWWFSTLTDKESEVGNYDPDALSSTQMGLTFIDGTVNGITAQYSTRINLINDSSCDDILSEADAADYYEQTYSNYDLYYGVPQVSASFLSSRGIITIQNDLSNDVGLSCPGINITNMCYQLFNDGLISMVDSTSNSNWFVYTTNSFTGNQMILVCATTSTGHVYAPQITESNLVDNGYANLTGCLTTYLNDYNLTGVYTVCLNVLQVNPPQFLNVNAKHMDWLDIAGLIVAIESFMLSILVVVTQIFTNKEGAFRRWFDKEILKRQLSTNTVKEVNNELSNTELHEIVKE